MKLQVFQVVMKWNFIWKQKNKYKKLLYIYNLVMSDPTNDFAQAVFIVLSFCSLLSNVVIYSDKISENENVKKVTNVFTVFKEYVTNNYDQDEEGNIVINNNIAQPVVPDSKKLEKDIKELLKRKDDDNSINENLNTNKKNSSQIQSNKQNNEQNNNELINKEKKKNKIINATEQSKDKSERLDTVTKHKKSKDREEKDRLKVKVV